MPPAPVDPDRLRRVAAAFAPLHDCARAGADDVLALFPEVGDRATQIALDAYLEQVADLLAALDLAASDLADQLRTAASQLRTDGGQQRADGGQPGPTDGSRASGDQRLPGAAGPMGMLR